MLVFFVREARQIRYRKDIVEEKENTGGESIPLQPSHTYTGQGEIIMRAVTGTEGGAEEEDAYI
jgi:hypothetical protein